MKFAPKRRKEMTYAAIVDLLFDAQGEMTLNELCGENPRGLVLSRIRERLDKVMEEWVNDVVNASLEGLE